MISPADSIPAVPSAAHRLLTVLLREIERSVRLVAPTARIHGRVKTAGSTTAKATRLRVDIDQVLDRLGIRVVVDDARQCYRVADMLHAWFAHVAAEHDDYIRWPKANGYRALHSILLDRSGRPFEVQVRSHAMHLHAQSGASAHEDYKRQPTPSTLPDGADR